MVLAIDPSLILAWSQAQAGITGAAGASGASGTGAKPAAPTPPWQSAANSSTSSPSSTSTASSVSTKTTAAPPPPPLSATAKVALDGGKFFDPNAAKLDVQGANANTNQDYKDLFAVYQGLDSLNQLAQQMTSASLSSFDKTQIQQAFTAGMSQLQSFVEQTKFNGFQLAQGKIQASEQTTVGVPQASDTYTGSTVYAGAVNGVAAALTGNVAFTLTDKSPSGAVTNVDFDLSEMGATPRTVGNVVNYLNGKLTAAGVSDVKFSDVFTQGAPQTVQAGGKTVNLSNSPDQFALQLSGLSIDSVTLSAPASSPAVYVAQTSGNAAATTPDTVQQLLKLQTDPTNGDAAQGDRISSTTLGPQVQAVRASAASPDGSLYVLADVTGTTSDGQTVKGQQDVALLKYDSSGKLLYTQTLGAADSASGYGLAVSADGAKVAVTGTVTGLLQGTSTPSDPTVANTFVSVFNAAGEEQWTARGGSTQGDQPSAVSFGADGAVYVTGQTLSVLPGATSQGGPDGYLKGFTPTGAEKFAVEFGTSGIDSTGGIAVSGSSVYVAGVENGHAVVRQYGLQASGPPTLTAERDLGDLQGGNIAGIGLNSDGSIVVAGSTHNASLAAGQVGAAFQAGKDAFVATLQPGLAASSSDTINFYQGAGDTTAAKMTLAGGQVYLAGQITGPTSQVSGGLHSQTGFAVQVDPTSGAVGWSSAMLGLDNLSSPNAIAVDPSGASVLDQLGLPTGQLGAQPSQLLTASTSLRVGDKFSIVTSSGGLAQTVTIQAGDTLATLATRIQRASDYQLTAKVLPAVKGEQQLKLAPVNPRTQVQLIAGPQGTDALASLGLTEGVITNPPANSSTSSSSSTSSTSSTSSSHSKPSFSLGLPSTLALDTPADALAASKALAAAIATVKNGYTVLSAPPASKTAAKSGPVPTYLTNELANYQAGLNRLTGGASASSSTTSTTGTDPNSALLGLF